MPAATIHQALLDQGVEAASAERIARAARGRIGWALTVADDPDGMLRRRELVEQAYEQVTTTLGRISISGTIARDHSKRRDTTYQLLDLWTGLWRDALLHRVGLGEQAAYPEVADRLAGWPTVCGHGPVSCALGYPALHGRPRFERPARAALHAMVMQWPE